MEFAIALARARDWIQRPYALQKREDGELKSNMERDKRTLIDRLGMGEKVMKWRADGMSFQSIAEEFIEDTGQKITWQSVSNYIEWHAKEFERFKALADTETAQEIKKEYIDVALKFKLTNQRLEKLIGQLSELIDTMYSAISKVDPRNMSKEEVQTMFMLQRNIQTITPLLNLCIKLLETNGKMVGTIKTGIEVNATINYVDMAHRQAEWLTDQISTGRFYQHKTVRDVLCNHCGNISKKVVVLVIPYPDSDEVLTIYICYECAQELGLIDVLNEFAKKRKIKIEEEI